MLSLIHDPGHRAHYHLWGTGTYGDGSAAGQQVTILNILRSKGVFMKTLKGWKTHLPINGIFHMSCISILSFFVFISTGYRSTDVPVKIDSAPVVIGAAASLAGSGGGSGLTNRVLFTAVNDDIGTRAASTLLAELQDEEADYTETLLDSEPVGGTIETAHPPCQDSCSL